MTQQSNLHSSIVEMNNRDYMAAIASVNEKLAAERKIAADLLRELEQRRKPPVFIGGLSVVGNEPVKLEWPEEKPELYSLDQDPEGIRARVADAIRGSKPLGVGCELQAS